MNLQQVYNALYSGATVEIVFDNKKDADNFRTNLYHCKKRNDKVFVDLGELTWDDVQSISWKLNLFVGEPHCAATIKFVDRIKTGGGKDYNVRIVEDEPPNDTGISSTSGGASTS